jgi:hypothetical protein
MESCIDAVAERRAEHAQRSSVTGQDKNRCVDCHRVHVPKERHEEIMRDEEAVRSSALGQTCPSKGRYFGLVKEQVRILELADSPVREGGVGCGDIPATPPSRAGLCSNSATLFFDGFFSPRAFQLQEGLGTNPRVFYLAEGDFR